jgi:small subunit ribosomal protein S4
MARYTGPKFKLDRREGTNLFLKGKRSRNGKHPIDKKGAVPPGQHGNKNVRRKVSSYGLQLREKQKAKRIYGLLEKQFRKYYQLASRQKGATGETLMQLLEKRLDNTVFRSGVAMSRNQARQLVSHGHVLVNEKKVNIPSFLVKTDDVVSLDSKAANFIIVQEAIDFNKDSELPNWLERKGTVIKIKAAPSREDINEPVDEQLIVEFYSR